MKKILFAIFALALALGSSMPVYALTATTTMPVSLTLVPAVTVSATSLSFGTSVVGYGGLGVKNATITVNAASGTAYTVTLDAGLNYSSGVRLMMSGATIGGSYTLHKEAALTTFWGDTGFAGTVTGASAGSGVTGTGSGANQTLTVYGWITSYYSTPGVFTDTVTVTVNY